MELRLHGPPMLQFIGLVVLEQRASEDIKQPDFAIRWSTPFGNIEVLERNGRFDGPAGDIAVFVFVDYRF